MTNNKKAGYIIELETQLEKLAHRDEGGLDSLLKRAEMIIRNVFDPRSKYLSDLGKIHFHPMVYPTDDETRDRRWRSGVEELKNLLRTMVEELSLFGDEDEALSSGMKAITETGNTRKVFVVHGHDHGPKNDVARFLEKLKFEVVILHEKANQGNTLIEKFEKNSRDISFAVVLLTPDDVGGVKGDLKKQNPRARQNVVFELGYFIGSLGRSRVVALTEPGVEKPSDYEGVAYIDLLDGRWKLELAREMKAAGLDVDMNLAV